MAQEEYVDNDFYDGEEYDYESEFEFDCGAMFGPNGEPMGCSMAGSEDCDWECPYREEVERSLRASYAAKCRWANNKAKSPLEARR